MNYEHSYAVYGRTSKDTDDAFSVSSQIDAAKEFALKNGLHVPDENIFREDFTGKAFDRPEYSKIQALIRSHSIKGVIIYSTDRLARRVGVGEHFLDEMFDNNVTLYNISWGQALRNTPEDRLRFNFETTFSSFERDKIMERTMRGKTQKVESGRWLGGGMPLFGYDSNEFRSNLIPNDFGSYVTEIMQSYGEEHIPVVNIAAYLNARGIPTPGALHCARLEASARKMFAAGLIPQNVFDKRLENANRFYKAQWGDFTIHNLMKYVDAYAGNYKHTIKGVEYFIQIPPLISQETAENVKKMLKVGKARFSRGGGNPLRKRSDGGNDVVAPNFSSADFLMARRLRCKDHRFSFAARMYWKKIKSKPDFAGFYRCSVDATKKYPPCSNKAIRNDVLDPIIKAFLSNLLINPQRLFAWWEEQNQRSEAANEATQIEIDQIQSEINNTKDKLYRVLDRLTDKIDDFDRAYYVTQRDNLKQLLIEYEEREEELKKRLVNTRVDPKVIRSAVKYGEQYRHLLEETNDLQFWRTIVDALDLTGEIGTDENGQFINLVLFDEIKRRKYLGADQSGRDWEAS